VAQKAHLDDMAQQSSTPPSETTTTPLLASTTTDDAQHNASEQETQTSHNSSFFRSEAFVFTILIVAILALSTGDQLQAPAQTRIIESIYCRSYYAEHDPSLIGSDGGDGVAEVYCKNHVIQGQVAMLRGWQITIEAFVMLLVSVPWGYAADVYGRKPVVVILVFGLFLRAAWIQVVCWFWKTIPIKAVWAAAGFTLLGGGDAVTIAIVFTIISDVVPEARRASKFFLIGGSAMFTQVVGPFGSAALMELDPWIPNFLGLALQGIVLFPVLLLPETKDYRTDDHPSASHEPPQEPTETASTSTVKLSPFAMLKAAVQDSVAFLASDTRLLLLIPAFFMHMLVSSSDILVQYISTRYGLSLADATFVITMRSACVLALMLAFYPVLNHILRTRLKWHPQRSDLYLSRFCVIVTAFGFLFMAVAPSLPLLMVAMAVNTLGSGLHLYLRNLATSLVEPHHVARLMTLISWIDTAGLMIASPSLAWLFERGVDLGGLWMGLPFLFTAGIFGVIGVFIGMISLSGRRLAAEEEPLLA